MSLGNSLSYSPNNIKKQIKDTVHVVLAEHEAQLDIVQLVHFEELIY